MDKFIEVFYLLVYNEEEANYYWHNYGTECGLKWGFYALIICSLLTALFFYFFWSNTKVHVHASLKSWFKVGFFGMFLTFLATEIIVGMRCEQLEGITKYIGESGSDIVVFSLYNSIVGFAICYLSFSTMLQLLSSNAKNIPWLFMYRK